MPARAKELYPNGAEVRIVAPHHLQGMTGEVICHRPGVFAVLFKGNTAGYWIMRKYLQTKGGSTNE